MVPSSGSYDPAPRLRADRIYLLGAALLVGWGAPSHPANASYLNSEVIKMIAAAIVRCGFYGIASFLIG